MGDKLLVAVTDCLQLSLSGQFTLVRIGGDKFVLLADISAPDDAARLASTLVQAIDARFMIESYEQVVTIALYPHEEQNDHNEA